MAKVFSAGDVAAHKSKDDLYIIVDEDVYDLTKFQDEHPGKLQTVFVRRINRLMSLTMRQADRRVRDPPRSPLTAVRTDPPPVLQRVAGKDASKQFWKYHNESILKKYKPQLQVGSLDSKRQEAPPTPPATPPAKQEAVKPSAESGTVAPMPGGNSKAVSEVHDTFGDLIPYGDPNWYQSVRIPLSFPYSRQLTAMHE